ncbi:MAG TPA: hypothetical protein VEZ11_12690 [Thermoanaerobaculia bacterium]|nr:hypothetical protein [Thermoanaerobaculia bacterium]
MKRTSTDVLGRSFESVIANWPLLLLRVAASIVTAAIAIGAIVALVASLVIYGGMSYLRDLPGSFSGDKDRVMSIASEIAGDIARAITHHWLIVIGILVYVLVVFAVMLAIHAFVQGGAVLVYIDAEKKAELAVAGAGYARFAAFSAERWIEGGRRFAWRIFCIYNIAGGAICTVLLVPLMVILLMVLALRNAGTGVVIAMSCLGILVTVCLAAVAMIVIGVWSVRAIVDCAVSNAGATESVRLARVAIRNDLGRHLAIAGIIMAISFGASMFSSGFSGFVRIPHSMSLSLLFASVHMVSTLVTSAISAVVAGWFLAAFTSLGTERH